MPRRKKQRKQRTEERPPTKKEQAEQQRRHLEEISGLKTAEEQALWLTYGEQRQDTHTEPKTATTRTTTKAGRIMGRTTTEEKIGQLRRLLSTQKYAQRTDLKAKLDRLNLWTRATNEERRADQDTPEDVEAVLDSDLFAKWNKEEQYRYTTYEATTEQGGITTLTNKATVGKNQRHHRIPTDLYERTRAGQTTVKEVVETITNDKRNDYPTHYLLQWLGFTEYAVRHYIETEGREIEHKNRQRAVLLCGIPTHYAVRPRTPQEREKYPSKIPPQTIDERTGRPLQDFIAQILARIHRGHRGQNNDTETFSDISEGNIGYDF